MLKGYTSYLPHRIKMINQVYNVIIFQEPVECHYLKITVTDEGDKTMVLPNCRLATIMVFPNRETGSLLSHTE